MLQYDAVLRASTPSQVQATTDGPGVPLDYAGIPGRAHQITFTAPAGQWLFVNRQPPDIAGDDQLSLQVTDAEGRVIDQDPLPGVWLLPAPGEYRLTVTPYGESDAPPNTIELRSVRSIGTMPADGTPTTFSTTYPGEPVLATVSLASSTTYLLQATSVASPTGWSGFASSSQPVHCAPNGPLGCQPESGYVDQSHRTSATFTTNGGPNPWYVLMNPGLGASGTVQLAITPTP